ncbi:DUF58 domain-containing protein [Eionea flava]
MENTSKGAINRINKKNSLTFFQRWLNRRIPPSKKHYLYRKNIFILPSITGMCFLLVLLLVWLLGTNYQNNLAIILAFLLLSLMHTCMFYTYASLSGLSLDIVSIEPCFLGEMAKVQCRISSDSGRMHHQVTLSADDLLSTTLTLNKNEPQMLTLLISPSHRGYYQAKRIRVASSYPLGLLTAWSHLDMAIDILTYPQPLSAELPENTLRSVDNDNKKPQIFAQYVDQNNVKDEISHLREYQFGDSLRQIAWKSYAKGQGLSTKQYDNHSAAASELWLTWHGFSGLPTELRLSKLCDCILQAESLNVRYGLELPNSTIKLGKGKKHQEALLFALAVFDTQRQHKAYSDKEALS